MNDVRYWIPRVQHRDTQRDLSFHAGLTVRAETVDVEERTVEAVVATETPAQVIAFDRFEVVDEVLLMSGARFGDQLVLLETHDRFSLDSVLGSIRNLHIEDDKLVGRLHFMKGDERADRAFEKIRQGHLTDVSVGYRVDRFKDIEPGESETIDGRTFTATGRVMRISTLWTAREGSLVPIGADEFATVRNQRSLSMNPKVREFLEKCGLDPTADEATAKRFMSLLSGEKKAEVEVLSRQDAGAGDDPPPAEPAKPADPPAADPPAPDTAAGKDGGGSGGGGVAPDSANAMEVANRAVAAERDRVSALSELRAHQVVTDDVFSAWVKDGTAADAARTWALSEIRKVRATLPASTGRGTQVDGEDLARALAAGLLIRQGMDPTNLTYSVDGIIQRKLTEFDAERGNTFKNYAPLDICRTVLERAGVAVPSNRADMARAAVSAGSLANIFTTVFNVNLLRSYDEAPDTSDWCSEIDVPDFKPNERPLLLKMGQLTKHARGGEADDLNWSDQVESYSIARFSGKFSIDEMDIVDDRLGAFQQVPQQMGWSAAALRPDIVYSILLANAALGADSTALFHANHGNTSTGALTISTLETTVALMHAQRMSGRPLNLTPSFILLPSQLRFVAANILGSEVRLIATGSAVTLREGANNPIAQLGLSIRIEDRLGANGTTDPATGTAYTGDATRYYMAAAPGIAPTIEIGFLAGSGRRPTMRPFTMTEGKWGIGWDVKHDIGAKALDHRGLLHSTGA